MNKPTAAVGKGVDRVGGDRTPDPASGPAPGRPVGSGTPAALRAFTSRQVRCPACGANVDVACQRPNERDGDHESRVERAAALTARWAARYGYHNANRRYPPL
jgi:hypothetical protein